MYIIFDTETTGLPQNYKAPITDTDNWTRLVQLAWIEYDKEGNETHRADLIVKPDGFVIPQDAIDVHRITNEKAHEKGIPIKDVLSQFTEALKRNHYLIAHNISFDEKIMGAEFVRANMDYSELYRIEHIDTKQQTVSFCKLPKRGGRGYKWPTLTELHQKLFKVGFDDAHDAMIDVEALARCFFELQNIGEFEFYDIPQQVEGLDFIPKERAGFDYTGNLTEVEIEKPVIALGVHTDHSLLRGAATVNDYIKVAKELNHPAIGITDWCTMSGTLDFWMKCKDAGIHPILGIEMMVNENIGSFGDQVMEEGEDHPIKIFIKNQQGYVNLNRLLYMANTDGFRYPHGRIKTEWLIKYKEGLIITAGDSNGFIADLIRKGKRQAAEAYFKLLHQQFGEDFYVEIRLNELTDQKRFNAFILSLAKKHSVKVFVNNDVYYAYPEDNELQDTLMAIGQKAPLSSARLFECRNLFYPSRRDYLKFNKRFGFNYPEDVLMNFMDNTIELGRKCRFDFEVGVEKYPKYEPTQDIVDYFGSTDTEDIIYKLAFGKLNKKLKARAKRTGKEITKEQVKEYHDRLNYELGVIKDKKMLDYFLVNWELIRHYRSTGHEIGAARGSGGGSLLSYALDITKIDPLKYGLYFERFLNPTRNSPPDLDIDFESDTQDIIDDFLEKKYGANRTFHVCTLGTFNEKSCLKDVARALLGREAVNRGSDIEQVTKDIDRLSARASKAGKKFSLKEFFEEWHKDSSCNAITKAWLTNPDHKKVMQQTLRLQGRVKQLGQHAAGVVITPSESWNYIPTNVIAENGAVVSAFPEADGSFKALSYLGILKLDTLKIGAMNIITSCIEMVKERRGIDIKDDIVYVEDHFDDPKLYEEIRMGLNHGIFQFESSGMNGLIRSIQIDNFNELAAANALFRPGPMGIGADKEFIRNKFSPESISYIHPIMEKVLSETNGVMVFQEQVQFLAKEIAGFDYGKGDMLRRYMDKGSRFIAKVNMGEELSDEDKKDRKYGDYEKFLGYWEQFIDNAKERGFKEHELKLIQEYMLKYLGYSFNKCLSENCEVEKESGEKIKLLDVKVGDKIKGYNPKKGEDEIVPVKDIHHNGKKKVYKLKTASGKTLECTMDHKIMTEQGMKPLSEIIEKKLKIKVDDKN